MNIIKAMEKQDRDEKAAEDIQTDHLLYIDPYETGKRHMLILEIKRTIQKKINTNDKEAA